MITTAELTRGDVVATLGIYRPPAQTRRARSVRRVNWRTVEGVDHSAGLCRVRFSDGTYAVCLFDDTWHRAS